jgi:hypothetical protein
MQAGKALPWAFVVSILAAQTASASIIVQAFYRLGDADPGATANAVGNDTTQDSSGNGRDLSRFTVNGGTATTPTYKNDKVAPTQYGNQFAAYFDGGDYTKTVCDRYNRSGAVPMGSYWGMEAWIYPTGEPVGTNVYPVLNAKATTEGAGLRLRDSVLYGNVNGTSVSSGASCPDNQWTYVALVQQGTSATLYAKTGSGSFQTVGSATVTSANPTDPSGFEIGAWWSNNGAYAFTGYVDEVRVFTFNPGEFSTADLLVNTTVLPEPGALGLLSLGLLLLRRPVRRNVAGR